MKNIKEERFKTMYHEVFHGLCQKLLGYNTEDILLVAHDPAEFENKDVMGSCSVLAEPVNNQYEKQTKTLKVRSYLSGVLEQYLIDVTTCVEETEECIDFYLGSLTDFNHQAAAIFCYHHPEKSDFSRYLSLTNCCVNKYKDKIVHDLYKTLKFMSVFNREVHGLSSTWLRGEGMDSGHETGYLTHTNLHLLYQLKDWFKI